MTDMNLFDSMNRALGGGLDKGVHIEAMGADEIEAITEAQVVPAEGAGEEEDDTDEVVNVLTRAVEPTSINLTGPPVGNALNNAELDQTMSDWLNNRMGL